jgi:hypothetical protein
MLIGLLLVWEDNPELMGRERLEEEGGCEQYNMLMAMRPQLEELARDVSWTSFWPSMQVEKKISARHMMLGRAMQAALSTFRKEDRVWKSWSQNVCCAQTARHAQSHCQKLVALNFIVDHGSRRPCDRIPGLPIAIRRKRSSPRKCSSRASRRSPIKTLTARRSRYWLLQGCA